MLNKIKIWYKSQSDTTKGMIWFGIVLIIGIILRWDYIMEHIAKGFNFYSTK
ncbi:MAG: hypothetical protein PHD11_06680 [Bacteroidales bacterium]|nr:hypothetical protein [Bacteroidales bacterium]MDD4670851.1 hypothetical protein [Bacteroidales bacterium]